MNRKNIFITLIQILPPIITLILGADYIAPLTKSIIITEEKIDILYHDREGSISHGSPKTPRVHPEKP